MATIQVASGSTTTTTTVTTSSSSGGGGKVIGVCLMVLGSLGILLGLVSIIYSVIGINLALEGSGVEAMQKKCADTFANYETGDYVSFDTGICSGAKHASAVAGAPAESGGTYTDKMCGNEQEYVGCSFHDHKKNFQVATGTGTGATVVAGLFAIAGSIPILLNGIFTFLNKEKPSMISAGCGVGLSVPSLIAIAVCAIVLLAMGVVSVIGNWASETIAEWTSASTGTCSPQCKEALTATASLGDHKSQYFGALTWLAVALMVLMLLESIFACVSCCTWKRKMKAVSSTVVHSNPVQATVVEAQAPKTEVVQ